MQVHKLEIEYAQKYAPLYRRRAEIVSGEVEPTASECLMPGEEPEEKTDNEKQVSSNSIRFPTRLIFIINPFFPWWTSFLN